MGRGFGRRGFCGSFTLAQQTLTPAEEREMLDSEVKAAAVYLKNLQARQKELGGK